MSEPLITVIIPAYRAEKRLGKCVESVCAQTWRNLEILIIDSKPLPQVTENHGAVFLKLEVARHVFSETIRSWNKVQMYKQ